MHYTGQRVFIAALLSMLAACGSSGSPDDVEVYKSDQSVQCDASSGVPLAQDQQALVNAGIDVLCAEKTDDGLGHPTVCGGSTGSINLFQIRGSNLDDAEDLGFSDAVGLPNHQKVDCVKT